MLKALIFRVNNAWIVLYFIAFTSCCYSKIYLFKKLQGFCSKIQGIYFKICALCFKISALCFLT